MKNAHKCWRICCLVQFWFLTINLACPISINLPLPLPLWLVGQYTTQSCGNVNLRLCYCHGQLCNLTIIMALAFISSSGTRVCFGGIQLKPSKHLALSCNDQSADWLTGCLCNIRSRVQYLCVWPSDFVNLTVGWFTIEVFVSLINKMLPINQERHTCFLDERQHSILASAHKKAGHLWVVSNLALVVIGLPKVWCHQKKSSQVLTRQLMSRQ